MGVSTSLTPRDLAPIVATLRRANAVVARAFPGDAVGRQPVHTAISGAHLFRADSARVLGRQALAALDAYAADAATFARALDLRPAQYAGRGFAEAVLARVRAKLHREPVEDIRIDFEDGYGNRPDEEEDAHAQSTAVEVAAGMRAATLPPFIGIRIKPLSAPLHARSLRTLDLFVTSLVRAAGGLLPANFVVTITKVMGPAQVAAAAGACGALERCLALAPNSIRLELMIETPQSILAVDGSSALRTLVAAGAGRVRGAIFGTYDYIALCGITASWQHMRHPACDFARHMMQVSLAQSGVWLSDGGTSALPVAPHAATARRPLSAPHRRENREAVHRAWKIHFDDVQHSLMNGYYQGWDLHPAQLPTRYAAVFAFFLAARPAATARLRSFVAKADQATLVGDVFDDAATGQALLNFFSRGLSSGALTADEVSQTGLTPGDLRGRSFLEVLDARRHAGPSRGRHSKKGKP